VKLFTRDEVVDLLDALTNADAVEHVIKPWGDEHILHLGELVIKVIRIHPVSRTSKQHHETKDEVHFILAGKGQLDGSFDVALPKRPSVGLRMPPRAVHRAVGPLLMLELSTAELDDVVRHEDDYLRETT
jgi:mannose-6-phosphate isomerase-like protein (cupin superfamily)